MNDSQNTKQTAHTPTPWEDEYDSVAGTITITQPTDYGQVVCIFRGNAVGDARREADAAFIVRACNSFDELVRAVTIAKMYGASCFDPEDYAILCAALVKAGAA